jgi:hypothetical protein
MGVKQMLKEIDSQEITYWKALFKVKGMERPNT